MSFATTWTEKALPGQVDDDPASPNYGKPCLLVGGPIGPVLAPIFEPKALAPTAWARGTLAAPAFARTELAATEWKPKPL